MNNTKIDIKKLIEAYQNGETMTVLAKMFGTYPMTIKRILEKNNVELRHDAKKTGKHYVRDGEKLIEWAKTQDRLVTKTELAQLLGKKRLSSSYLIKYPELKQYISPYGQDELQEYYQQLYEWLRKNNISYRPNDKKVLGVVITALLFGPYENIAIQIDIKPKCVSKKRHTDLIRRKLKKANEKGLIILFLKEKHFEDLDNIKKLLDSLKYSEER